MYLRPMIREDMAEVVNIELDAFEEDRFHQWLNPTALQPEMAEARRRLFYTKTLEWFVGTNAFFIVCVEPLTRNGTEERILGAARWHRKGPADSPTQQAYTTKSRDFTDWFESAVATPLRRLFETWISPNPSKDASRWRMFIEDVTKQDWNGHLTTQWYLGIVGVNRKYGRKGVGRMLVEWGMKRAQEEGVPLTLESSEAGEQFYDRLGFKIVDWAGFALTHQLEGGSCRIYDPERKFVRDIEPGEDNWVEYGGFRKNVDVRWRAEYAPVKEVKA